MAETMYPPISQGFPDQQWDSPEVVHIDSTHQYEMEQNYSKMEQHPYMTPPLSTGPPSLPFFESQSAHHRAPLPAYKPMPIDPEAYSNPLRIYRDSVVEDLIYNRSASAHVTPHGTPNMRAERSASVPGQPWQPIAPWPPVSQGGSLLGKRRRADTDVESVATDGTPKRRRADVCSSPTELNEEERLLLRLKEEQNLPWKDIAIEFKNHFGRVFQVPALQMRFKRLRERLRRWTEADVAALRLAVDYWERCKWDIIAEKMLDFDCEEKWAPKFCHKKWGELHQNQYIAPMGATAYMTPDLGLRSPRASIQDTDESYGSNHPSPVSRSSPAPPSISQVPGLTPSL